MKRQVKKILRIILSCLLRVIPTSRHCIVHGVPDMEGNSVEVVRYLAQNYRGKIYWLVSEPREKLEWVLADLVERDRVIYMPKQSRIAFIRYLTAEIVFYTHGLYLSPKPGQRRIFVNLWHGDGPKKTENKIYRIEAASTVVVAGTRLWGHYKARFFGLQPEQVAIVGNPRIDQFERPADDKALRRLGIDPAVPFILWLPTYRKVSGRMPVQWDDGGGLDARECIRKALAVMVRAAGSHGIQVIFKPHPMEADNYADTGVKMINDTELNQAHVPFYALMARSCALITDYSSVWTDYLPLRKPIAFICPDINEYEAERGFNVDNLVDILPGRLLINSRDIGSFITEIERGEDMDVALRESIINKIGAVIKIGATKRLFEWLKLC